MASRWAVHCPAPARQGPRGRRPERNPSRARRTAQATRSRAEAELLSTLAGSVLRGEQALAALLETTSLPVQAVGRDETFGPDDPAVKQARAEIAEMKRLGIWERHA